LHRAAAAPSGGALPHGLAVRCRLIALLSGLRVDALAPLDSPAQINNCEQVHAAQRVLDMLHLAGVYRRDEILASDIGSQVGLIASPACLPQINPGPSQQVRGHAAPQPWVC
jgi:hypothetical protein